MSLSKEFFEDDLGFRVDTSAIDDNYWPHICLFDSKQMIRSLVRDFDIDLLITSSKKIQAAAAFEPPTIIVTMGLALNICKLAARLVGSGVFVKFGETDPKWSPKEQIATSVIENELQEDIFIWNPAFFPWIDSGERQILYVFLVTSMFRYIVLHELGHVHFGHGRHRKSNKLLMIDGVHEDCREYLKAIDLQAKEVVADGYALNAMLSYLNYEYSFDQLDPARQMLREKMLPDARHRLRASLIAAFLVFQLLDRLDWTPEEARYASHPPAPFRMKTLYAASLEQKNLGLPEQQIGEEIRDTHLISHAIIAVGFDKFPNFDWIKSVTTADFDAHFGRIHQNMPKWIGVYSRGNNIKAKA